MLPDCAAQERKQAFSLFAILISSIVFMFFWGKWSGITEKMDSHETKKKSPYLRITALPDELSYGLIIADLF